MSLVSMLRDISFCWQNKPENGIIYEYTLLLPTTTEWSTFSSSRLLTVSSAWSRLLYFLHDESKQDWIQAGSQNFVHVMTSRHPHVAMILGPEFHRAGQWVVLYECLSTCLRFHWRWFCFHFVCMSVCLSVSVCQQDNSESCGLIWWNLLEGRDVWLAPAD